jgi:hypothetical protein
MNRFVMDEIFIGWKKDKRLTCAIFLVSIIAVFCMGICCILWLGTNYDVSDYKEVYEDMQFYTIADRFTGDAEWELLDPQSQPKFRIFIQLLQESPYFDYFMLYSQHVDVGNYRGKIENRYGYEYSSNNSNVESLRPSKDGVERSFTSVKGFWIGEGVTDYFHLDIKSGRAFQAKDYIFNPNQKIHVILGSNYSEDYNVGDHIYINFIFAEQEAEIVGFLEEGSNIYYRGAYQNLDRYLIMPMFLNDDYEGRMNE